MANQEHVLAVTQGPEVFALWRSEHPASPLELEEADLSAVDLRGAKVRNANLRGANLAGAILSRTSFARADLSGANLTGAEMAHCVLAAANCRNANLTNVNLYWADLKQADLQGACLRWSRMVRALLLDADLTSADVSSATMIETDLRNANLSKANFQACNLNGADLSRTVMEGADFTPGHDTGLNVCSGGYAGRRLQRRQPASFRPYLCQIRRDDSVPSWFRPEQYRGQGCGGTDSRVRFQPACCSTARLRRGLSLPTPIDAPVSAGRLRLTISDALHNSWTER